MGDELLLQITPLLIASKRLRVLKLAKNKLSDNAAGILLEAILTEQNKDQYQLPTNVIATINFSNNVLTDKSVDLVLELSKNHNTKLGHKHIESMHV